jgi:hypothetical protein
MADFGNTGTITVRASVPGVTVHVTDGEYLFYQLTVSGAFPIFVYECKHETRLAADALLTLNETTADVIGKIRRAPQLSFTFQSKLRNEDGKDEYRTGLLFDYGVWDRFNVSLNGTFDYADSKVIGGDTRAGRFAAEGIFQLTPNKSSLGDPRPFLLSTFAEAKWANNNKSTYTGQLKLTIPIPGLTGMNFPISVSVVNRPDLIEERVVRGRFGFTIDHEASYQRFLSSQSPAHTTRSIQPR